MIPRTSVSSVTTAQVEHLCQSDAQTDYTQRPLELRILVPVLTAHLATFALRMTVLRDSALRVTFAPLSRSLQRLVTKEPTTPRHKSQRHRTASLAKKATSVMIEVLWTPTATSAHLVTTVLTNAKLESPSSAQLVFTAIKLVLSQATSAGVVLLDHSVTKNRFIPNLVTLATPALSCQRRNMLASQEPTVQLEARRRFSALQATSAQLTELTSIRSVTMEPTAPSLPRLHACVHLDHSAQAGLTTTIWNHHASAVVLANTQKSAQILAMTVGQDMSALVVPRNLTQLN